jgi:hypothetical protein
VKGYVSCLFLGRDEGDFRLGRLQQTNLLLGLFEEEDQQLPHKKSCGPLYSFCSKTNQNDIFLNQNKPF